jgi:pimeloyl-ACP methyl ester carboxylesterase
MSGRSGLDRVWSVPTVMVRELAALGPAAVLFPLGIMAARNAHVLKLWAAPEAQAQEATTTPVVLVHGYGGDRSNWLPVEAVLGRAGRERLRHAVQPAAQRRAGNRRAPRS